MLAGVAPPLREAEGAVSATPEIDETDAMTEEELMRLAEEMTTPVDEPSHASLRLREVPVTVLWDGPALIAFCEAGGFRPSLLEVQHERQRRPLMRSHRGGRRGRRGRRR